MLQYLIKYRLEDYFIRDDSLKVVLEVNKRGIHLTINQLNCPGLYYLRNVWMQDIKIFLPFSWIYTTQAKVHIKSVTVQIDDTLPGKNEDVTPSLVSHLPSILSKLDDEIQSSYPALQIMEQFFQHLSENINLNVTSLMISDRQNTWKANCSCQLICKGGVWRGVLRTFRIGDEEQAWLLSPYFAVLYTDNILRVNANSVQLDLGCIIDSLPKLGIQRFPSAPEFSSSRNDAFWSLPLSIRYHIRKVLFKLPPLTGKIGNCHGDTTQINLHNFKVYNSCHRLQLRAHQSTIALSPLKIVVPDLEAYWYLSTGNLVQTCYNRWCKEMSKPLVRSGPAIPDITAQTPPDGKVLEIITIQQGKVLVFTSDRVTKKNWHEFDRITCSFSQLNCSGCTTGETNTHYVWNVSGLTIWDHIKDSNWKKMLYFPTSRPVQLVCWRYHQLKNTILIKLIIPECWLNLHQSCLLFLGKLLQRDHLNLQDPFLQYPSNDDRYIFNCPQIPIQASYKPISLELHRLTCQGELEQLFQIGNLYDIPMILPEVNIDTRCKNQLAAEIIKIWKTHLTGTELPKCLPKIEPVRHIHELTRPIRHAVQHPISSISNLDRKKCQKWVTQVSANVLDLSTKTLIGVQNRLEDMTHHQMEPEPPSRYSCSPPDVSSGLQKAHQHFRKRVRFLQENELSAKSVILQPLIGAVECGSKITQGLHNQLQPDRVSKMHNRYQ